MNKTRRDWSGLWKCCREKQDSLTAFYSLAGGIFGIAIAFYGVLYWFGSKHPETEPLDEREISRSDQNPRTPLIAPNSLSAPPASSPIAQPKTNLIINKDDSDDDEILDGAEPPISQNQNLILID